MATHNRISIQDFSRLLWARGIDPRRLVEMRLSAGPGVGPSTILSDLESLGYEVFVVQQDTDVVAYVHKSHTPT